jgi:hypothetical protein
MGAAGRTTIAFEDLYTIDEHDVLVDPQTGLPQAVWSKDNTIRNKVDIFYNYNDPALRPEDFGTRQVWTADASVTRHGPQPAIRMECRGIRTDLGGQALMDGLALNFLQRWGYTPPMLRLAVTFRRHLFEILDSVRLTHPLIKNPMTGRLGLDREQFEVLEVTPAWLTEGKLILLLLWTGAVETSAAPTSGGVLNLVPGLGATDETDVPVPLAGSATVTTAANTRRLTLGLKQRAYRAWECVFNAQTLGNWDLDPKTPDTCQATGLSYVSRAYTSQVTYKIEYKTSGAPDSPGSGSDPTTGWVTLKASSTRGTVALFNEKKCTASPQAPSLPTEDAWQEHFEVLGASPATYNVKVFFESVAAQANPCSGLGGAYCSSPSCSGTLDSSQQTDEDADVTIDYVTSIS